MEPHAEAWWTVSQQEFCRLKGFVDEFGNPQPPRRCKGCRTQRDQRYRQHYDDKRQRAAVRW